VDTSSFSSHTFVTVPSCTALFPTRLTFDHTLFSPFTSFLCFVSLHNTRVNSCSVWMYTLSPPARSMLSFASLDTSLAIQRTIVFREVILLLDDALYHTWPFFPFFIIAGTSLCLFDLFPLCVLFFRPPFRWSPRVLPVPSFSNFGLSPAMSFLIPPLPTNLRIEFLPS